MINFFYSDPHFGHRKLAEVRGFKGYDAKGVPLGSGVYPEIDIMDTALMNRYRALVELQDVVLWLGDCFFCGRERAAEIIGQLPGRKILLRGNHDQGHALSWYSGVGFDLVMDGEISLPPIAGHTIRACHLPYAGTAHARDAEDNRYLGLRPIPRKGEILLHGHTHSTATWEGNGIHVGCDAWDLAPVSWAAIDTLVRHHTMLKEAK